jgi:hypothetical protein
VRKKSLRPVRVLRRLIDECKVGQKNRLNTDYINVVLGMWWPKDPWYCSPYDS